MRPNRFLITTFLIISALFLISVDAPPPAPASPETEAELSAAFFRRLELKTETGLLAFDLFTPEVDAAFVSPDGKAAVIWLALRDDSGHLLATEPGLVLAKLTDQGWQVLLPGDAGWDETIALLPEGMLPAEHSPAPDLVSADSPVETLTIGGYYLPYAAGTSRWLEGSISHFQYIPELGYPSCTAEYCRYAFDFTDADHFPILASKGGTVYAWRDSCSNGSETCTNYIVLRNQSEGTYQIYLHLANGTIPSQLKSGSPSVVRGQYLGDTDDTGYSTSNHVHFMVVTSIWQASGYYWGRSIDIRFADVSINNGLPRTCYEVTSFPIYDGATECIGNRSDPRNPNNDWFVSGNTGAYPPTGALTRPASGAIVTSGSNPLMDVSANATDDVRVTAVRLVAKINNHWTEIGPRVTQQAAANFYDWDVNLCDAGSLNGPLEVALRIWDHEGNVVSALNPRTIQVDYACPGTSQMSPAVTFDSSAVQLNWTASNIGGGFGTFEIQWRTSAQSWDPTRALTIPVNQRSTWFIGQQGTTYFFRMRVVDSSGRAEAWPANDAVETTATLPSTCEEDSAEQDDSRSTAKVVALGESAARNICGVNDPDWFVFTIAETGYYRVRTASQNGGAAVKISIFDASGTVVLASGQAAGPGQPAIVLFYTESPGTYSFKVEPLSNNLMGTGATYTVVMDKVTPIFLPLISR